MTDQDPTYRAYLLRLWRDGVDAPWRASLLPVGGEQARHFADVAGLLAFVQQQTKGGRDDVRSTERT